MTQLANLQLSHASIPTIVDIPSRKKLIDVAHDGLVLALS